MNRRCAPPADEFSTFISFFLSCIYRDYTWLIVFSNVEPNELCGRIFMPACFTRNNSLHVRELFSANLIYIYSSRVKREVARAAYVNGSSADF